MLHSVCLYIISITRTLQELKRQRYLEITIDKTSDPSVREYHWGERAHLEFPKKELLELVCKVFIFIVSSLVLVG